MLAAMSKALDHVKKRGAVHTPNRMYEWMLITKAGLLHLSFNCSDKILSVFGMFERPADAAPLIRGSYLNPHSGKWNSHWLNDEQLKISLEIFMDDIESLTEGL